MLWLRAPNAIGAARIDRGIPRGFAAEKRGTDYGRKLFMSTMQHQCLCRKDMMAGSKGDRWMTHVFSLVDFETKGSGVREADNLLSHETD
jgi:hypothetical protein